MPRQSCPYPITELQAKIAAALKAPDPAPRDWDREWTLSSLLWLLGVASGALLGLASSRLWPNAVAWLEVSLSGVAVALIAIHWRLKHLPAKPSAPEWSDFGE